MSNSIANKTTETKYTYLDCITGKCGAPTAGHPGKLFFSLLMVGFMCTSMTTFNGMRHHDWDFISFFIESHWMYPLMVPLAMLVRLFIADKIAALILPTVKKNFDGPAKALLIAVVNVSLMTPLMTAVVTILLQGFADFGANYLEALPASWAFALALNFLVVSPMVKLLHYNVISSVRGMQFMRLWTRLMKPVTALFN
mgnify:FL=1